MKTKDTAARSKHFTIIALTAVISFFLGISFIPTKTVFKFFLNDISFLHSCGVNPDFSKYVTESLRPSECLNVMVREGHGYLITIVLVDAIKDNANKMRGTHIADQVDVDWARISATSLDSVEIKEWWGLLNPSGPASECIKAIRNGKSCVTL